MQLNYRNMKTMKNILPLIFTTFISTIAYAQNENNYWFFGQNAGLDFSSGTASVISGGLNTYEGCASISDSEGNLLFYTDGTTVYNSLDSIMINGTNLSGNP